MKKKFIINLTLLVFINLLIKPFWVFGIDRTVQNIVGAENYGFYVSILSFSFLLNIILDFGITNFNNRNIAQHHQLLQKHFSNIVVLKSMLGVIYLIISVIVAFFIGYDFQQLSLFLFLGLNQFLLSFILYLRSNISGLQLFKTDSFISVLDRTLMIIFCSILLWGNITSQKFKIEWFVYVQTISYLLTSIIAFFIVSIRSKFIKFSFNKKFFLVILKQTYPFAILTILMMMYTRVDLVMIERMLINGKTEAGIYAQSFRILDAVSMFAFLFANLLLPMFSRMLKQKENIVDLFRLAFKILIVPAIILAFISFNYKLEILGLLYHEHIIYSSEIFAILMTGFIAIASSYIFGTLITANGNLKELNIMAGSGMLLNLILNFILIPKYQAKGAAIASVVTQFFTALVQIGIAQKKFKNSLLNWKIIFSLLFFILTMFILTKFINYLIFDWFIQILFIIIIGITLAFITKVYDFFAIINIIKKHLKIEKNY